MAPELLTTSDLGADYAPEPLKLMAPRYRAGRLPCGAFNRAPTTHFLERRFRSIIARSRPSLRAAVDGVAHDRPQTHGDQTPDRTPGNQICAVQFSCG